MANKFGAQLHAFAKKTGDKLEDVDVAFKLGLFERVIRNTRVADPMSWKRPDPTYRGGQMRGGWQVTAAAVFREGVRNTTAALPVAEVGKVQPFSVTYLSNAVPYAPIYEEKDAMMGRAIADAQRALAEAVNDVAN